MVNRRDMQRLLMLAEFAEALPGAGNARHASPARVAAALFIKNQIIAVGHNQSRTCPFHAKYGKNPEAIFPHAETNVIKKALSKIGYDELVSSKTTIYICRIKKTEARSGRFIWGLSKPCCGCVRALSEFKINRVVFTLDEDIRTQKEFEIWSK